MTAAGPLALDAIVLAGGRGRRMGTDKVLLEVDGERLVDRVVRRVGEVASVVVVAAGPDRPLVVPAPPGASVVVVADSGDGPLAGVAAALPHLAATVVAVVAADQPDVDAGWLREAGDRLAATDDVAVVPVVTGRRQVLHAVYRRAWLTEAVATGDRSLTRLLATAVVTEVRMAASQAGFATDLDDPSDLARRRGY